MIKSKKVEKWCLDVHVYGNACMYFIYVIRLRLYIYYRFQLIVMFYDDAYFPYHSCEIMEIILKSGFWLQK